MLKVCPDPTWWLEMSISSNEAATFVEAEGAWDSRVVTPLTCECFLAGGCETKQPIGHDSLIQACSNIQGQSQSIVLTDRADVMWDGSAMQEHHGRCPHTVDIALRDSDGIVLAKTRTWFGIEAMAFAVPAHLHILCMHSQK